MMLSMVDAECRGEDPAVFFDDDDIARATAKTICARCAIRAACLAENLQEPFGVYGGMTPQERYRYAIAQGLRPPVRIK